MTPVTKGTKPIQPQAPILCVNANVTKAVPASILRFRSKQPMLHCISISPFNLKQLIFLAIKPDVNYALPLITQLNKDNEMMRFTFLKPL